MSAGVPLELSTGKQGQGSASFGPAGHTVVAPAFPVTVCHHAFSMGMGVTMAGLLRRSVPLLYLPLSLAVLKLWGDPKAAYSG